MLVDGLRGVQICVSSKAGYRRRGEGCRGVRNLGRVHAFEAVEKAEPQQGLAADPCSRDELWIERLSRLIGQITRCMRTAACCAAQLLKSRADVGESLCNDLASRCTI